MINRPGQLTAPFISVPGQILDPEREASPGAGFVVISAEHPGMTRTYTGIKKMENYGD